MDQDLAPEQMMRIARLRPLPFSSTTVALESCSSDHFPKRSLYISERICTRAQARVILERFAGPRSASHSLHHRPRPGERSGARARSRGRGIGSPVPSLSVQRRRNIGHDTGAPWGDSTRQHTSSSLGPRCFI
ncbi:hypothetical protein BU23DRAFT_45891 [Bimuria novae-zelandiae CBS 107.79]|uniref:Uncharacterized protein n=1 Tax=Bimuria novae-zelandiae CBS 107.79 TaxID=1447943 RepID=A0A6A5VI61_9PLEO|nr:hypothetical protein BU23DRAFT_45891 [Bimuria novae-zelandiae CBS 107.79]